MKKTLLIAVALLALTGCDSDKDKAIKAAEAKITAMTDNITGITFSDMEYFPGGGESGFVCGKYRTDSMRLKRFVIDVGKPSSTVKAETYFLENSLVPEEFDSTWEVFCK